MFAVIEPASNFQTLFSDALRVGILSQYIYHNQKSKTNHHRDSELNSQEAPKTRMSFLWIFTSNDRNWSRSKDYIIHLCIGYSSESFSSHCKTMWSKMEWNKIDMWLPLCWPNAGQWIGQYETPNELVARQPVELIEMPCLHRNCTSRWMIEMSNGHQKNFAHWQMPHRRTQISYADTHVWLLLLPPMTTMPSLTWCAKCQSRTSSATYRPKWATPGKLEKKTECFTWIKCECE